MPEIFRADGCVVKVFINDHDPAHVHVTSAEYEIKVDISGPVAVVLDSGKKHRQNADAKFTKKALRLVNARLADVKTAWKAIHGK
ncbi:MAG: DUF4160 domain-containing protein [Cyanobacteria bacterium J06597_16]